MCVCVCVCVCACVRACVCVCVCVFVFSFLFVYVCFPDGGFLAGLLTSWNRIGCKYKPTPSIAHRQALFWSGCERRKNGIQRVMEFVQCELCDDEEVWVVRKRRFGSAG